MSIQFSKCTIGLLFVGAVLSNSQIATANQLQTICGVIPNGSVGDVGVNTVQNCSISGGEVFPGIDVLYTGTASSSADYGTLKASSSITTKNLTSYPVSGQSIAVLTPSASSFWTDNITVTSSTLPNGSPVNLQAFISLHAVFSDSTGLGQATFGAQGGTSGAAQNTLSITYNDTGISGFSELGLISREWEYSGQGTQSIRSYGAAAFSTHEMRFEAHPDFIGLTINIPTYVGQQIGFSNQLSALSYGILGTEPISLSSFTNANNTSLFYLSSSSADVSWLSESGASYLAPLTAVPEPDTYAMFLAGLGIMGFAVLRRRNHNA